MVCVRVAFHENDGNQENDEGNSDSYEQGVECWIRGNHGNHGNDDNHGKPRVPQTTGLEIQDFCVAGRESDFYGASGNSLDFPELNSPPPSSEVPWSLPWGFSRCGF